MEELLFIVIVPDGFSHDLAVKGLRKLIDELDDTGILIRSCLLLYVVLDLFLEFFSTLGSLDESDGSLYDDASDALRVRCAGNGTLENIRKLHDDVLDLEGSDSVTGRLDDVVRTSDIGDVSVLIHPSGIARVIPAVVPSIVCELRCEVVLEEQSLRMIVLSVDADLACFTRLANVAVGIEDLNVVERIGLAHGSELDL